MSGENAHKRDERSKPTKFERLFAALIDETPVEQLRELARKHGLKV